MPKIVDHQQRRDTIAEVAANMIASVGLEHATIREIARASGFSKGIIEHYFDSKEDLIASALEWVNQRYQRRVLDHVGQRQGLSALRTRLEQTLPLTEHSAQEWKIRLRYWSLAAIDPRFQATQSKRWQAARDAFAQDLRRARQLGEIEREIKPSRAAERILFVTSGISAAALHSPGSVSRRQLKACIDELVGELTDDVAAV